MASTRPKTLNCLPVECLLYIFDQLTFNDLIRLDQVTHQWRPLVFSALCRRREFALLVNPDKSEIEKIPFCNFKIPFPFNSIFDRELNNNYISNFEKNVVNVIKVSNLGVKLNKPSNDEYFTEFAKFTNARLRGELTNWIDVHFPNLQSLTIIHPFIKSEELKDLNILLNKMKTHLFTLNLWFRPKYMYKNGVPVLSTNDPNIVLLFKTINKLPSLKQLTIDFEFQFETPINWKQIEFGSIISRLHRVHLNLFNSNTWIIHLLDRFARSNHELKEIGIPLLESDLNNPNLPADRITHLHMALSLTQSEFCKLCHRFTSLKKLGVSIMRQCTTFKLVLFYLPKLIHLTHLVLFVHANTYSIDPFSLNFKDPRKPGLVKWDPPKCSTIQNLSLIIFPTSHKNFYSFPDIFSSVQNLEVFFGSNRCDLCGHGGMSVASADKLSECQHFMIESLQQKFPKLNQLVSMSNSHRREWQLGSSI